MSVLARRTAPSQSRRRLLLAPLLFALAVPTLTSPSAGAAPAAVPAVADSIGCRAPSATVGDLTFRRLPAGLGARWDSSPYSYDDIDFVAAVWESGSDRTGWSTDLHITVMTGDRLGSPRALHDWFIEYQERPADEVAYRRTTVRGAPGWITRDQIFWLVRPGLAASVTLDASRWSAGDLRRLVNSYSVSG